MLNTKSRKNVLNYKSHIAITTPSKVKRLVSLVDDLSLKKLGVVRDEINFSLTGACQHHYWFA